MVAGAKDSFANRNALERLLINRLGNAEAQVTRAGVLAEWQKAHIASIRMKGGREVSRAEAVLEALVEYRGWYSEMARQAMNDLRFLERQDEVAKPAHRGAQQSPGTVRQREMAGGKH